MSVLPGKNASPEIIKHAVALVFMLCAFSVTSCVSNVSSQIKESNKDTTGAFDGSYVASVQKSSARQPMPGNWIANCDGKAWEFRVRVRDGVAKNNLNGSKESAFVSTTGDFRFDIPVTSQASAAAGASKNLTLSGQTVVIYGNLEKAKGRYTFAVAEFGNNGCTAVIEFDKTNS